MGFLSYKNQPFFSAFLRTSLILTFLTLISASQLFSQIAEVTDAYWISETDTLRFVEGSVPTINSAGELRLQIVIKDNGNMLEEVYKTKTLPARYYWYRFNSARFFPVSVQSSEHKNVRIFARGTQMFCSDLTTIGTAMQTTYAVRVKLQSQFLNYRGKIFEAKVNVRKK